MKVTLLNYTHNASELMEQIAEISYVTQNFGYRKHKKLVKFASGRTIPFDELGLEEDPKIGRKLPGFTKDDKVVSEIVPSSADTVVRFLLTIGHMKPFECVNATFRLDDISRKTALHLLRYEFITTNMRSQKYLNQKQFEYIMPPKNESTPRQRKIMEQGMSTIQSIYESLRESGIDPEWARGVLPNLTSQTMTLGTNLRQFRHLFDCLCNEDYVTENRQVAMEMFSQLRNVLPVFFEDFKTFPKRGVPKRAWRNKIHRNVKVNFTLSKEQRKAFGL